RCSVMDLRTPVMSAGFQANMSRLFLSRMNCYLDLCFCGWFIGGSSAGDSATILHSVGTTVLLCNVTIPSRTGNLSIPCAVDGLDIGGGALNFTVSIARISFGVLMSGVNLSSLMLDFCLFLKSGFLLKLGL
ncbi:hypothetical protein Tco_1145967, partial [Tanacetum coccineum]